MNKRWYIHTMKYYLPIERKEWIINTCNNCHPPPPVSKGYTIWFHLHNILKKTKLYPWMSHEGLGGAGVNTEGKHETGSWNSSIAWLRWQLHKSLICAKIQRTVHPEKSILLYDNLKNKINATFTLGGRKSQMMTVSPLYYSIQRGNLTHKL